MSPAESAICQLLSAVAKEAATEAIKQSRLGEDERLRDIAREAARQYAEAHPRPSHVNGNQAAKMLGVSAQTITRNYWRLGNEPKRIKRNHSKSI